MYMYKVLYTLSIEQVITLNSNNQWQQTATVEYGIPLSLILLVQ